VQSIKAEGSTTAQARLGVTVNVSAAELADASKHPDNWLTYSGTYDGRRFSGLKQLSRANAARLQVRWIHQLDGDFTRQQTVPLVYRGIMFLTSPPARLSAIDAATGKLLWRYEYRVPADIVSCCGIVNRGAAILGNQVFFATIDAHLIALDAETGKVNWQREVADHRLDYTITGAPLAVNDLIVTGISGGEFATRGFIAAFRASDGKPVWRFETVPGPGTPGNETWEGTSWKNGGASTWMTGSFDPVSNTLYWGIGNPAPQLAGDLRRGDNLYSSSVVALDAGSGVLRWHFQFTPHDTHDWDSAQVPVLVEEPAPGRNKLLSWANRNGFFYSLDAGTGKFMRGRPFAKQTWAEGLDADGRPIVKPGTEPSEQGTLVLPSSKGAINWWPPAYDPVTNLLFVPAMDRATVYFSDRTEKPRIGSFYKGGTEKDSEDAHYAVRALNALSGEMVWEQPGTGNPQDIGGLLATAGGLVFGSIDGLLRAMDTRTGQVLWSFDTGAQSVAPPVTYRVNGEQFLVVAAGKLVLAFSLPPEQSAATAGGDRP
jgi:alcohol dehydrogenase (cytochrome c)